MSLPPPQTKEFADRLTTLAQECRDELEQASQSMQEIAMLIKQTQSEVERLNIRENQQNLRVREMETSIESFPRAEIRDVYTGAHEVQLRLFMMRSQLEQLESRRESIQLQQEKIRTLLNLAEISREQGTDMLGDIKTKTLGSTRNVGGAAVDIGAELIQAQERERVRIARQLIDGPAQVLANLLLRAEIVQRVADRAPEALNEELSSMQKLAARSLLDIRRAIFEMRPLVLDELGLVPTLRRYANDFARENGATITISGPDRDNAIAGHARVALFRIIQQSMLSLVTPGVGTQVQVDVRFEEAQLVVRMDATSVGPKTLAIVDRFAEDSYTTETLDLIGANLEHEPLSNGARIAIIVPLLLS
jgi:two-component system sensor histidine kinase DegS